jgi:hypothetical protein
VAWGKSGGGSGQEPTKGGSPHTIFHHFFLFLIVITMIADISASTIWKCNADAPLKKEFRFYAMQ